MSDYQLMEFQEVLARLPIANQMSDCQLIEGDKFKRTSICTSSYICRPHVLLPPFQNGEKHTDVPWRPYREVERAFDFEVGNHRATEGGG